VLLIVTVRESNHTNFDISHIMVVRRHFHQTIAMSRECLAPKLCVRLGGKFAMSKTQQGKVEITSSPLLGEPTDEVLGELGYNDKQIAALHAAGVI
jgi:crotonobetainyl-CoA:carnitine CoA-transferase CaiB-like acyl-CoA transferase